MMEYENNNINLEIHLPEKEIGKRIAMEIFQELRYLIKEEIELKVKELKWQTQKKREVKNLLNYIQSY